jgi:WD40 repeat protein
MNDLCADNSSVLCTNDFRPDGIVVCGTFSPSKLCVAMSLSDGSVKLLHLQSDGLFASQQLIAGDSSKAIGPAAGAFHTTHHVGYLSFSPCGAFLACVTRHDPKVCIYDIATSCLLHTLHCSEHDRIYPCTQNIQAVSCILQMNCMLLAVGKSGSQAPVPATDCSSVQLWRMQEGFPATCIQVIRVKDTDVLDLSFSPASSSILALVSSGPTRVHMWVTKTSTAKSSSSVGPFDFTSTNFRCMDWDDDEGAIVTKLADGPKDCSSSGRRRSKGSQSFPHFPAVFGMHAGNLVVVRRSPNCNPEDKPQDNPRMSRECLRACATFQHSQQRKFDSVIHKIDVTSKVISHEFRSVAISPSGLQLASCGEGGIGLWDLRTGQLFRQFGSGQEMRVSYLVCSGAVILASFDKLGVLKLWV